MASIKKKGLGKGLDALFEDNHVEEKSASVLKITEIEPNRDQPRTDFDEIALRELADSIRTHGVLQPIVVRPIDAGNYQIVAGERRWRASRMAGLSEVPVIIKELNDSQTLEIAIIENLQREDLNVVELALGYKTLMENYDMTQEQVAEKLGKSRPVIANTMRLLNLPEKVIADVRKGTISTGHAKALLSLEDDDLIIRIAQEVVSKNLLVRDIEKLARDRKISPEKTVPQMPGVKNSPGGGWGNSFYKEIEIALSQELGRKVTIAEKGKKAVLSIEVYNREELSDIAEKLVGTKK